jgi:hypothetical protein
MALHCRHPRHLGLAVLPILDPAQRVLGRVLDKPARRSIPISILLSGISMRRLYLTRLCSRETATARAGRRVGPRRRPGGPGRGAHHSFCSVVSLGSVRASAERNCSGASLPALCASAASHSRKNRSHLFFMLRGSSPPAPAACRIAAGLKEVRYGRIKKCIWTD